MKLSTGNKVVLIGAGDVSVAYAYSLVNQDTVDHLAIIDIGEKRTMSNVIDLNHGVVWTSSHARATQDMYADCDDATLVVICAGATQKPDETCLQLVDENTKVVKSIVDSVMASGFDGLLLIAANPIDVFTYTAWKYSGLLHNHVFGSGTILDTTRFRYVLGGYYDVFPMSVHTYIIGEHSDSELPVLPSVNVAGVSLSKRLAADPTLHNESKDIFTRTRDTAYEVIDAGGSTSYGTGMELAHITRAIFQNQEVTLPVSAYLRGEYGREDVFIGTPAIVNRRGIRRVIKLELDKYETKQLDKSVQTLRDAQGPF